ncbi:MAG: 2-oxoacid:ferredoxin oxidoreductase subunit alpha [Candidatus Nitrosocaldaceae archaeon]
MNIINELSWVTGGPQGSGVDTSANIFARACYLAGLHIYGKREYHSNIKGEHSYFTIRVSNKTIRSHLDRIDMLVALDAETIFRHLSYVSKGASIIYDSSLNDKRLEDINTIGDVARRRIETFLKSKNKNSVKDMLDSVRDECSICSIPFNELLSQLAAERGESMLSRLTRVTNIMSVASSLALLDLDVKYIHDAIKSIFKSKTNVIALNIDAANKAYNYTKAKYDISKRFVSKSLDNLILLQGTQAAALGKISAGCRFQTYYPITPATDESEFLESNQIISNIDGTKGSLVVIQTEDEISAITMATGAAIAGARSSTSTSGPGFSLMAEGLSWAGMNEVPVVITLYQRAGPSTGLPTRHEQGDLLFAINAGHGEFPRAVIASGDVEEIYYDTIRAFNYAERYQMPVIHILDKALANSLVTCKVYDTSKIKIDRGLLIDSVNGDYKRFRLSDDGISTRVRLGTENGIFWNTGDEHDEYGHITEDPEMRDIMMEKRMKKLDTMLRDLSNEEKAIFYDNNSDKTIITWGSPKGAILDAISMLDNTFNMLQIKLLQPFPSSYISEVLSNTQMVIDVEMNYSAQLAKLIKLYTNKEVDYRIVKYNGRPISADELYYALSNIINGSKERRVVLRNGV